MALSVKEKVYNALDIANFLIYLMSDSCDDLSNMKLNKILYYAQGHFLQNYNRPLFSDTIEAWQHGPVVKAVYAKYKDYKDKPISEYDISKIDAIDNSVKSFLLDIARKYGRYTAYTLRNMTHRPKSPWAQVDEGEEITLKSISDYFEKYEDRILPLEINYSEEDFVGHRDSDGILVLPEDWHDAAV